VEEAEVEARLRLVEVAGEVAGDAPEARGEARGVADEDEEERFRHEVARSF
jgi:hypothetical protein